MSFLSCFQLSKTSDDSPPPPLRRPQFLATQTSYTYQTDAGTVTVTWSQSIFGRSLQLQLHNNHHSLNPSPTFNLHINTFPFSFRNKKLGHKSLSHNTRIFWNLSKARFGNRPEPESNYLLALTLDDSIALLLGDVSLKDACATCKARDPKNRQVLVTKKDYVDVDGYGASNKVYSTTATMAGRTSELEVEYHGGSGKDEDGDSRLLFSFDGDKILEVKRLRWKFRGNERVEIGEGGHVQITWDVHNWLFKKEEYQYFNNNYNYYYNKNKNNNLGKSDDGRAVFMFKFEEDEDCFGENYWNDSECGKTGGKSLLLSSSFSMSSSLGSFAGSSSVMEWSSLEESELIGPIGLTLLVHAWRIGI